MVKKFDYVSETDLTASNVFSPENVGVIEFTDALAAVIHAAQAMDKYKKALFRQRTREESGLDPVLRPGEILLSDALGDRAEHFDGLFHGIVGAITEVGEMGEILMDFLTLNKEPDITNVKEETGDVLWYLSRLIKWAKTTFDAEMQRNIAKLRQRHGQGGFNKDADITRDLAAEHEVLDADHIREGMEVVESVPDLHCPECGADVDENCDGDINNCPRHETGQFARDGHEHKNEGLADYPEK